MYIDLVEDIPLVVRAGPGPVEAQAVQGVRFEIAVSLLQNSDLLVGWRENTF